MKNQKQSEVVVVTGASAGVGRAVVREFARRGASIALLARGVEGLEAAKTEAECLGARALMIPADVALADQVEAAAQLAEKDLGPIDIWVNNAMTSVFSPVKEMTAEEFRRVTEVTYLGVVYGTVAALKRMLPRNHGTIVQVGSALAYRSIPLQAAYCGAKHAIRGFTDSLRSELIHDHSAVHVTMVQLPALNTPQFDWVKNRLPHKAQPLPPIFQPEVAAEAIYFAAHEKRREIFVGIPAWKAILGNKIMPSRLDQFLAREGYSGQQTEDPADPGQPDNLWQPVAGDHGAHGHFDRRARRFSPQLWINKNRDWLALVGSSLAGWGVAHWLSRKSNGNGSHGHSQ